MYDSALGTLPHCGQRIMCHCQRDVLRVRQYWKVLHQCYIFLNTTDWLIKLPSTLEVFPTLPDILFAFVFRRAREGGGRVPGTSLRMEFETDVFLSAFDF
jgi:hypothetical protein